MRFTGRVVIIKLEKMSAFVPVFSQMNVTAPEAVVYAQF